MKSKMSNGDALANVGHKYARLHIWFTNFPFNVICKIKF